MRPANFPLLEKRKIMEKALIKGSVAGIMTKKGIDD